MASTGRVKAEPVIKPDPEDAASPAAQSEDEYEDAGDLEFYDPNTNDGNVYIAHVPKYVYDQWTQLNDDEEVQIGTMRQWTEVDKKGEEHMRLALLLDHKEPLHQMIPKEYTLDVKDMDLHNTFMFTEQDLPGYKSRSQGMNSNIPAHLRPKPERPRDNVKPEGGRKRYQPYYRKAIPKKTVLAGRFKHEVSCVPVPNAELSHIMAMRASDAGKPKATTSIMTGARTMVNGLLHAGTASGKDKFGGFVQRSDPKAKAKKQKEERAARLDQAVIRDKIFTCFKQYRYWTMTAFKQALNQPEAWLRENLEILAVLHKSGPFANHWELKPEYSQQTGQVAQLAPEAAPDVGGEGDDSDSDGDDEEMEDVMPS